MNHRHLSKHLPDVILCACAILMASTILVMEMSVAPQPTHLVQPLPTCELTDLDESTWHGLVGAYADGHVLPLARVPDEDIQDGSVRILTIAEAHLP